MFAFLNFVKKWIVASTTRPMAIKMATVWLKVTILEKSDRKPKARIKRTTLGTTLISPNLMLLSVMQLQQLLFQKKK